MGVLCSTYSSRLIRFPLSKKKKKSLLFWTRGLLKYPIVASEARWGLWLKWDSWLDLSSPDPITSGFCVSCQKRDRWGRHKSAISCNIYILILVPRNMTVLLWPCLIGKLLSIHPHGTTCFDKGQRLSLSGAEVPSPCSLNDT